MKVHVLKFLSAAALLISANAFATSPMNTAINLSCNGYNYGNDLRFTVRASTAAADASITVHGLTFRLNGTLDLYGRGTLSGPTVTLFTYRATDGQLYGSMTMSTVVGPRTVFCAQY